MKNLFWLWLIIFSFVLLAGCNQSPDTLFTQVSSRQSNITFKNTLKETDEFNVLKYTYFYNGGGVAIGDVNGDDLPDIYFTGNMVASHLYINQGNMVFENKAAVTGVEAAGLWNTGVTMADVNGDGLLDIYVCRSAAARPDARRNLLFINDGVVPTREVHFTESAAQYGLDDPSYSTQATFFDFDRDGDLDMYLLNHSVPQYANFTADIKQLKKQQNPHFSDKLYENKGNHYEDISAEAGLVNNVLGFGLGVAVSDFNQDGWPDVYVSNDFNEEDYLYINQKNGTFREDLRSWMDYTSLFSMGSDAGDVNNDGRIDILSLDMRPQDNYRIKLSSGADNYNKYQLLLDRNFYKQNMRNMLQLNQGERFEEVGQMAGISSSDWSWSALMADYDLDGWPDIFVTNGYARDYTNMDFMTYAMHFKMDHPELREKDIPKEQLIEQMPKIDVPNKMYQNEYGFRFKEVSTQWGFTEPHLSNGAAYADLDGDGDLDLVINNVNEEASLYQNHAAENRNGHFLIIQPVLSRQGQPGIGSEITLYADSLTMTRQVFLSRGFQSSVPPMAHFGLGKRTAIDSLLIEWPQGEREWFMIDSVDRHYHLVKGGGSREKNDAEYSHSNSVIFTPDTVLSFTHQEPEYNDFNVQSLIPRYYSRSGPSMAKGDLDGNGHEDVMVGGGYGQPATIWFNKGESKKWEKRILPVFLEDAEYADVSVLVKDMDNDADQDILMASGGNRWPAGDEKYTLRYYENTGLGDFVRNKSFPVVVRNASNLVAGDFNGDGLTDLFLGSGYKAQQYPLPAGNVVLWNKGSGSWAVDTLIPFQDFNCMAALWDDLDGNGKSELILGGEWEPVEVWEYVDNHWKQSGKSELKGLVTTLHIANLDDDPEKEIIAGNWGENSILKASPQKPLVLYYGDFDKNGAVDPILSYFIGDHSYPFVSRDDLTGQLPYLKKFFTSYHDYGLMTMEELLTHLPDYKADSVQILSSYILDYQQGHWKSIPLPPAAQVAPVFAIETLDFNHDGRQDIILAGNSRYNRVKIGEMEANHGVLLENQGGLKFVSVSPMRSGLDLSGEVRSVIRYSSEDSEHVLFGVNGGAAATFRIKKIDPSF